MISIIIPTYNEGDQIEETIREIHSASRANITEVIVVDGGSKDQTIAIARNCGAMTILSPKKGRAAQMNHGASIAKGEVLYFLHADSIPPRDFTGYITTALAKGFSSGC